MVGLIARGEKYSPVNGARADNRKELPENARDYLKKIEELMGVPIDIISTGSDRAQTIVLKHPFD